MEVMRVSEPEGNIVLKSTDNVCFEVSRKAARLSVTVKELIEDIGDVNEIPVKVKSDILKKIIEFIERNKDNYSDNEPKNEEDRALPELGEWENAYCDSMSDDEKVDMILASNLLDIKPLLDIVCISVANLIKGQNPEELRKVLERTNKPIPEDLAEGIPGLKKAQKDEKQVVDEKPVSDTEAEKRKRTD